MFAQALSFTCHAPTFLDPRSLRPYLFHTRTNTYHQQEIIIMCDPFNTSIEAALWDERHDLDPFIAEHYATNAQHELDRLPASQPFSARLAYVRRLHARYSALAATAQLPQDSNFEESDTAESLETFSTVLVVGDKEDVAEAVVGVATEHLLRTPSGFMSCSPRCPFVLLR